MGHGSFTAHKDVCDIDLVGWCIQGCGSSVTCLEVWHLGVCNVMLESQAINYFLNIPTAPSLKNVTSSLSHEEKI